jgi:hypothetical protein
MRGSDKPNKPKAGSEHKPEYKPEAGSERHVLVTPTTLVITLNEEDQKQARECLERSGKITFNFGEISVSSMTEVRRLGQAEIPTQPTD